MRHPPTSTVTARQPPAADAVGEDAVDSVDAGR